MEDNISPIPKYKRKTLRVPLKSLGLTPGDKIKINEAVTHNNQVFKHSLLFLQYILVREKELFDECFVCVDENGKIVFDNDLVKWIIERVITTTTNKPQRHINYDHPKKDNLLAIIKGLGSVTGDAVSVRLPFLVVLKVF